MPNHHRAKDALKSGGKATLENALRGSGDIGAAPDSVWVLQYDSVPNSTEAKAAMRLRVECVKPRDSDPAPPFVIVGKPYINDLGDFRVVEDDDRHSMKGCWNSSSVPEIRLVSGPHAAASGAGQRISTLHWRKQ